MTNYSNNVHLLIEQQRQKYLHLLVQVLPIDVTVV